MRRASRTGTRLTPSDAARSSWRTGVPGASSPRRIRERSSRSTASCAVGGRTKSPWSGPGCGSGRRAGGASGSRRGCVTAQSGWPPSGPRRPARRGRGRASAPARTRRDVVDGPAGTPAAVRSASHCAVGRRGQDLAESSGEQPRGARRAPGWSRSPDRRRGRVRGPRRARGTGGRCRPRGPAPSASRAAVSRRARWWGGRCRWPAARPAGADAPPRPG